MRISDWSSDVCASDLKIDCETIRDTRRPVEALAKRVEITIADTDIGQGSLAWIACHDLNKAAHRISAEVRPLGRSNKRRVWNECVSTCVARWSPNPIRNKPTYTRETNMKIQAH